MADSGTSVDTSRVTGFAIGDYRRLLEAMLARGYETVPLAGLIPDQRVMFLRHDVDLSLPCAVKIAQLEAELGLAATYYLLVATDMYNLMLPSAREAVRTLVALGHSIGLHFDPTKYPAGTDMEAAAEDECRFLKDVAGAPVETISFHRPSPELLGMEGRFAGRRHTYEPCFFHDIAYVSDSSGGWYRGHPLDHPAVAQGRAIQLLTHPIWWHSAEPTEPSAALEKLRQDRRFD